MVRMTGNIMLSGKIISENTYRDIIIIANNNVLVAMFSGQINNIKGRTTITPMDPVHSIDLRLSLFRTTTGKIIRNDIISPQVQCDPMDIPISKELGTMDTDRTTDRIRVLLATAIATMEGIDPILITKDSKDRQ